MRQFSGAKLRRVIDRSAARVPTHAHEWPVLSLFVLGAYRNETELGEAVISGPSAILYSARTAHRNAISSSGFEQIEIEFDPAWLGQALFPPSPVTRWIGGCAAAEARALVRLCVQEADEERLRVALRCFLLNRNSEPARHQLWWVDRIRQRLAENATLHVCDLAREVKRHPSWIGTAYRRAAGEGLADTAARFRIEYAARQLRETDQSLADIAVSAGFCDQSHMNRTFKRLLYRTPVAVRADRAFFRQSRSAQSSGINRRGKPDLGVERY